MTDYAEQVREYLRYCKRAAAELKLKGSSLDKRYHPTEAGALRLIYHRTPAEAQQIRAAFQEAVRPVSPRQADDDNAARKSA